MTTRETFEVSFVKEDRKKKKRDEKERASKIVSPYWNLPYSVMASICAGFFCVVILFTFFFKTALVKGESMLPTLRDGDRMLVISSAVPIERGDIVVISRESSGHEPLVKRVIAVGGDEVDIDFELGTVKVNGLVLDEPFIAEPISRTGDYSFPVTVPDGYVFVLGDNRNDSYDSRYSDVGFIGLDRIVGKVAARLFPDTEFGF